MTFIIGETPSAPDATQKSSSKAPEIRSVTTNTFMQDVIDASREKPVLVDFWAPWCGPCKQLTPMLEKAYAKAHDKVIIVKMNIDEEPMIPGQMGIQSIPAVVAFVNGQPRDAFMGVVPESEIIAFIEKLAGPIGPSGTEQALEQGFEKLNAKVYAEAASLFMQVLQEDQDNATALGGLAHTYIGLEDFDRAKDILKLIPVNKQNDNAVIAAQAALDLAEQTQHLGNEADLIAKLQANPEDHQARFDLALIHNAKNNRDLAVETLVEIIKRDKSWNEEAARKQLLTFFDAWGHKDPATQSGRRKLSTVLFS
jgi:putative thioredoxin